MRTVDEIKADIASTTADHDTDIKLLEASRTELTDKAKAVSKDINKAKAAKRSALRRLHLELGTVLAAQS